MSGSPVPFDPEGWGDDAPVSPADADPDHGTGSGPGGGRGGDGPEPRPRRGSFFTSARLTAALMIVALVLLAIIVLPGLDLPAIHISIGDATPSAAASAGPSASASLAATASPGASATPGRPTPTPGPTFITYVVKAGESLGSIADRYATTARSIAWWNRGTYPSLDPESPDYSPNRIVVGWTLVLMAGVIVDDQNPPSPSPGRATPTLSAGPSAGGSPAAPGSAGPSASPH